MVSLALTTQPGGSGSLPSKSNHDEKASGRQHGRGLMAARGGALTPQPSVSDGEMLLLGGCVDMPQLRWHDDPPCLASRCCWWAR